MSNHYNEIIQNRDKVEPIVEAVVYFENEVELAKRDVDISGYYQKQSAELPGLMEYRFSQLQEIEAILEYLILKRDRAHNIAFKKYLEGYHKSLSSRDADKYASADKEVYELALLINQITLIRNKFLAITKGLEFKHFQLTNLVKLKVAGMEDYYIEAK